MQKNSTLLITGGTGFLGVYLARHFLRKKYEVILLDTAPLTAKELIGKVTVIKADIRNFKDIQNGFKNVTLSFAAHIRCTQTPFIPRIFIFSEKSFPRAWSV